MPFKKGSAEAKTWGAKMRRARGKGGKRKKKVTVKKAAPKKIAAKKRATQKRSAPKKTTARARPTGRVKAPPKIMVGGVEQILPGMPPQPGIPYEPTNARLARAKKAPKKKGRRKKKAMPLPYGYGGY